jgi:hypothetical protein
MAPPADLATLVPDDADLAVGADIDATTETPLWAELEPALRSDLAIGDGLRLLEKCSIQIDRSYALVGARNAGDGRFFAMQGRGIGDPKTIDCVATQIAARRDGERPWTAGQRGCHSTLEMEDGVVFLPNSYTLIYAGGSWADEVTARLQSSDAPALPESLADALAKVDREHSHLWATARLGQHDRHEMPGAWTDEVSWLAVGLELDTGVDLRLITKSESVTAAANTREYLIAGLRSFSSKLAEKGAPVNIAKNPRVGVEDRMVRTRIYVSRSELLRIRSALGDQIRGRGLL